jgi:hypothetical protein
MRMFRRPFAETPANLHNGLGVGSARIEIRLHLRKKILETRLIKRAPSAELVAYNKRQGIDSRQPLFHLPLSKEDL